MRYNHPQKAPFPLSSVGFGAWQLGNNSYFGTMEDNEAIALVQEAVKQGVNVFDTAPGYGEGNSERLLGIALQGSRESVFINTKFGHTARGTTDFRSEALSVSIHESLSRLQTTYLDSIILHNPPRDMLVGTHPIYKALQEEKQKGYIHHYGVSIDTVDELEVVLFQNQIDVIELLFNVIHQAPKQLFDEIVKQGIILFIKVPLDSGWLTGKYTIDTEFTGIRARWTDDVKKTRLEIVDKIKDICKTDDLVKDALGFIQSFDAVTSVIPGTRSIKQLLSNVETSEYTIDTEKKQALMDLYDSYIKHQNTPW